MPPRANGLGTLLLAVATVVVLSRALVLAAGTPPRTAHNESRFFFWSDSEPAFQADLERMRARLRDGETVCLFSDMQRDRGWVRAMGAYYLPRQVVVVPADARGLDAPPCRRLLLFESAGRPVRLIRNAGAPLDR